MKRLFFLLIIGLAACHEDAVPLENTCGVDNPVEDLPWLQTRIERAQQPDFNTLNFTIQQVTYEAETLFIFGYCCSNCFMIPTVYNCQGEIIEYNTIDWDRLGENGNGIIYRFDQFSCTWLPGD